MTKRIKITGKKAATIRSTSKPAATVYSDELARALGAERVYAIPKNLSPPTLLELRRQLFAGLRSRGGRPGLEGAELRPKIPMPAEDWQQLEALAKALASDGFTPTAGQVGSQLLREAIVTVCSEARRPPLASRASEAHVAYSTTPMTPLMRAQKAARRHLQQAQASSGSTDRRVRKLSTQELELLFSPPGLPLVDKGADAPTTSIAILGDAGAGKTTLAISVAHAIAADLNGVVLYVATELAPTEIKYKVSLLGLTANVVAWNHRREARAGDIIGEHARLLDKSDEVDAPVRRRALESAWQMVEAAPIESPIRCIVIDAFPLYSPAEPAEPSTGSARDDTVTLIQAIEGHGASVVIVQEGAGATGFVPFVTDVVLQLELGDDPRTGERTRKLSCPKSRYAARPSGRASPGSIAIP